MTAVLDVLSAPLPNPAPADPTGGNAAIQLLISYVKWGVLIVCAVVAVASGAFMAWGSASDRPDASSKGKRALLWSVVGLIASAVAIPMINAVQTATS
ncbi:hypothetical protein [Actinoplanes sp. RD1]|uniref:hypothetical protein n=1 Tax=Actinoplanes sp. RD1 TaxID=3064538 RepID=UPI00274106E9|nr:hypothetical protein [Actinoplanes sp. RD1]